MDTKIINTIKSHLKKCDKSELEQAILRLCIGLSIFIFLIFQSSFNQDTSVIFCVYGALTVLVISWASISPAKSVVRRLFGAWIDAVTITCLMVELGEIGLMLFAMYLWVIFGNGFRYGKTYLLHSQALSILGMLYVINKNVYWQNHAMVGYSALLMLVILPIYVAALIKRMEEAKNKADTANQAKSLFLANMSHEIRTPLNGIIGMVSLFKNTSPNSDQKNIIRSLDSSSKFLLSLLNNVLDISKIEEGKIFLDISSLSIQEIMEETSQTFELMAGLKSIKINTQLPSYEGQMYGDPYLLRQVLANLMGNAVKFTEEGSITFSAITLNEDSDSSSIRFEVQDTGIGIPLHKQACVFESFTQAESSKTKKYGGSGLGLTIAKRLVGVMGGKLQFHSEENVGSKFWFDLNLKKSAEHAVSNISKISQVSESQDNELLPILNILICEDELTNQYVLTQLLQGSGHTVELAKNGNDMLDMLESNSFDIVITDLNMPDVNGAEALKLYRFLRPDDKLTKFILFTADATTDSRDLANEAGFNGFLTKPVDSFALFSLIAKLTGLAPRSAERWLKNITKDMDEPKAIEPLNDYVLNLDTLKELELISGGSIAFMNELLSSYLNDALKYIEVIESIIKDKKYTELRKECHRLKGASVGVGAKLITQSIEEIHKSTPEELIFRGAIMVKKLWSNYCKTRVDFEKYMMNATLQQLLDADRLLIK